MEQTRDELARDLMRLGDLDGASKIAEEEIQRAGDQGNTTELWRFRFVRAQILEVHGRVDEALKYLESFAPPLAEDVKSSASLKIHRGYCLGLLCRYEAAHRHLSEAEAMARSGNLPELQADAYLSRAFIFFRQQDYVSSDRLFGCALEIGEQVGGWYYHGHALWGIGKNLMIQGQYRDAVPWLEESLRIFEEVGARLSIAMLWGELGVCYLGWGDDREAFDLFQRSAEVERDLGAIHNYQVSLASIGNVYLHRGDHFMAISYYQRAIALAREIKDPVSIKKWTYNINLAYAQIRAAVDENRPLCASAGGAADIAF
jgi:tetratricopeptide (TPR) repeat protein